MSHLMVHLDQISVSCQGIRSLPFLPPKVFTNALLYNDDITSLIRDTEAHERALFSVPAPPPAAKATLAETAAEAAYKAGEADSAVPSSKRRQTVFNVAAGEVTTGPPSARPSAAPRRQTAVAAVLGGDLHAQIGRRIGGGSGGGDVDVNILLKGAEKLCSVYALPGALERIPVLRQKHAQQTSTLTYYEAKVAEQAQRLEGMNRDRRGGDEDYDDDMSMAAATPAAADGPTEEDLRQEEDEIRELERKKKELQERLRAMDKDLGGLLNM
ncbi:hypothetical protein Sste5346_003076 [Sporothrix stenoceras]|uniref:DASH complex subunit SPC34 n=1 Tax=Sporothrix stenoceras TaxID=5173 RepID=A0ABR3ZFL9_9PEZI